MKNMVLLLRNKHQSDRGSRSFAAEHHPLFKAAEIQFRAVDGLLILAFLAGFVGLVLLLAK